MGIWERYRIEEGWWWYTGMVVERVTMVAICKGAGISFVNGITNFFQVINIKP